MAGVKKGLLNTGTNSCTRNLSSEISSASGHRDSTHTHARVHTRGSSPFGYGSADVSKASFPMSTASLGAPLNSLGALSSEPGVGKRHSHFLPFSTRGLGGLAPILGKQEVWGQKPGSQVEQETASPGRTDSCPQGTGQSDCSEPPAHLC